MEMLTLFIVTFRARSILKSMTRHVDIFVVCLYTESIVTYEPLYLIETQCQHFYCFKRVGSVLRGQKCLCGHLSLYL
jgi:hypothetical protein